MIASPEDHERVEALLGRAPEGEFDVVVRDDHGEPVVIRNAPILRSGRPMPTRYWLVGATLRRRVGQLEAAGGVRDASAEVDPDELEAAHSRYAGERDAAVPPGHDGPVPSGGVGLSHRGAWIRVNRSVGTKGKILVDYASYPTKQRFKVCFI